MKKGFTLVELMASILILGVITLIGVGTYTKVSENIKEQQYENKVSYIETQAALFASDTGYLSTNVNHLVELGYVEADNENGEVLSPIDQKVLNDYVVTVSKEGDIYYGHFTDKEEADLDKIDMINENLEIIVTSTSGSVIAINKWSKENVTLTANIKNNSINKNDVQKITWYSNVDTKEVSVNNNFSSVNKYTIEVSQIMNTAYRVEVIFKDGTKYEARRVVKIDKQKPNIYGEDVRVENADVYTQTNKTTRLIASDQNGSGIAGYYIGTDTTCTSNPYYASTSEKYEVDLGNGTYYACVKDKVGNISERISFTIEKVDSTAPTCEIVVTGTKGDNNWYTSDVSFSVSGTDNESGIKNTDISSKKLSSDKKTYTVTGTVRDKAGNTGTCSVTVKRDTVSPTCSWNDSSYKDNWTKNDRTVTVTCSDATSDCSSSASTNSWKYTSGTHKTESLSYFIKDNAGHTTECKKDANVYVDKDAPTTPTSGAIGAVSGSNETGSIKTAASGSTDSGSGVKEYRYLITNSNTTPTDKSKFTTSKDFKRKCGTSYYAWAVAVDKVGNISNVKSLGNTNDRKNEYSAWGTCSKACGTGTQTRTNSCALVTTGLSQKCNTQGCCSSVYYKDGSTCTKKCGSGTYNRLAYSNYNDQRCSSEDKSSGGSACNTQDCCSKKTAGTSTYGSWGACSVSCGGGTQSRTVTTPYTSDYDGSSCPSSTSTESQSCNTHSCLPANTCKIRGTRLRTTSSWTCSHGHSQTQYYQIYCTDAYGNISAATSSPTRVCSVKPYGESDGWTLYSD